MTPSRSSAAALADPRLAALRAEVRALEQIGRAAERPAVPFGIAGVDDRLAACGLAPALHEAAADTLAPGDEAAATLFLAAAAGRFVRAQGGQVLWALARRDLFAPALAQAGLPPDQVVYADCRDDAELLAVMEEGLRYGGLAAVVGEVARAGMANLRRLQLGAEDSGTAALLLRRWRKSGADPLAAPSPAVTRWRIGCVPAAPLPYAGLGRACWQVALVRQRGGPPHTWILEAPDAEARLALAARSGDRPDQAHGADRRAAAPPALAA
ncbi:protein ImuA [Sphingosinicella sp. LHD-64]|uniref:ImuA family protein n=1 Tax=Sphingosinicella sp. LHD-64 TaxID=3072139 RepID=UPI00280D9C74|nr:protein ImuA [Sphingosinicella sp. LHD-64]MDQ8756070.1 protein ImuA [Sphingosinicella sp. LHD-64]